MTASAVSASAASPDYWSVLGLQPGADASSLKRAFRLQARRWHPDLNGNDPVAEERFKLVNEAYAVLSDPRRRRLWESGAPLGDGTAGDGAAGDPFASGFPAFETYLDTLFGDRGRRPHGADADELETSTKESTKGSDNGSDQQPRGRAQPRGEVTASPPPPPPVQAASPIESLVELSPEQALRGERVELELPDGAAVEVWTPPLAGDGWRLRLAGVAPGGADHFLQLRVRTPEGLRIDGLRVSYTLELSPSEAALGCVALVPTLAGDVQLRVPPGSSSGRLLRLRGRGVELDSQRGDQLVEIRIVVPEALSDAEVALYRRLQELTQGDADGLHQ
ncbi:MAG: DnaJ domain-containing protein [Cyanobacteriota bacterium]|nr:DnaJ domain-containing protein [Cyanobacteriota bacterium]